MPKPILDPEPQNGPRAPDEHEVTLSWVEERFRELRFNDMQAVALADAKVDWHDAEKLLSKGCDHATAVLLLMPDE